MYIFGIRSGNSFVLCMGRGRTAVDIPPKKGDNISVYGLKEDVLMKRILCILLSLSLLLGTAVFAFAEEEDDEPEFTAEEEAEIEEEEKELESDGEVVVTGEVYHEKTKEDFDLKSPALYTGIIRRDYGKVIWAEKSTGKSIKSYPAAGKKVDILFVGLRWLIVRMDNVIGYVKREYIQKSDIVTLDPVNTPPFNVQKHTYIAKTAKTCHVRKSMTYSKGDGDDGNNWVILKPGTELSIWKFYKGWAMVNYMREYGYIDPNELTDLIPVSPTDQELYQDSPIAAYTSYYKMAQTETNLNRIHNIKTGCKYISMVLQPGQRFDANKIMGPYRPARGYKQAGVLTAGRTKLGYGGGTCQVSSTLYNVLIQLPGIEINHRRPHGGNGASYLPIFCDAAVGNPELNLIFTNRYDFPIRIVGTSNDDGALLMRIYRYHGEQLAKAE